MESGRRNVAADFETAVDSCLNLDSNRMVILTEENEVQIWDSSTCEPRPGNLSGIIWEKKFKFIYPYGVFKHVTWAHPKIGQVIAISSSNLNIVGIWKEKVKIDENKKNLGKQWVMVSSVILTSPFLKIEFCPIAIGVILSGITADRYVHLYSPVNKDVEKLWELKETILCPYPCGEIVWNAWVKEENTLERLFLTRPVPPARCRCRKCKMRVKTLKLELYKTPFGPRNNDRYIVVPTQWMFALISKDDGNEKNQVCVFQHIKASNSWKEIEVDFNIREIIRHISFAPRVDKPFDLIAMAGKSRVFVYSLFQITNDTGLYQRGYLLHILIDEHISITNICWDKSGNQIQIADTESHITFWNRE